MNSPTPVRRFTLACIVGVARSGDGDEAVLRLQDQCGDACDLFVPTDLQSTLIGAMIQASQVAFEQRRARSAKDALEVSDGLLVRAWRFGFNKDWTQLRLQAITAHGPIELVVPASKANEFAASAVEFAEAFAARKSGVN